MADSYLAFDLGAGSGRALLGSLDDDDRLRPGFEENLLAFAESCQRVHECAPAQYRFTVSGQWSVVGCQ